MYDTALNWRLSEIAIEPDVLLRHMPQLIALRFASDAELPDLCRKVLDEKIADQKVIKRMIRNWQEKVLRA